jgi:NADPH2:quinone reductase
MNRQRLARAVVFSRTGEADVLRVEERVLPPPRTGEVLLRHTAVGVDFVDVYHRRGLYPLPLPSGLGLEAVGVVEEVGPGVGTLAPGDRVAYAQGPVGAYATRRLVPAEALVAVPKGVEDETLAASFLKGLTALFLLLRTRPLAPGETALFHAAAGGVGHLAGQIARARGLRLVGAARGAEKCAFALEQGYAACIDTEREDVPTALKRLTGGEGVPVVYDSVGRATWSASLDCLKPFGMLVSFGNASGPVPPVELGELARRGSLYVTRPTLATHWADPEGRRTLVEELFALLRTGSLRPVIGGRYPLSEAARAQRDLESRKTRGALLLLPEAGSVP